MTSCASVLVLLAISQVVWSADLLPGDADLITYEADFTDGNAHGWAPTNSLSDFSFEGGFLSTKADGQDANMTVSGLGLPAADISHVRFRMSSDRTGVTQVYFATTDSPDPAKHPVPRAQCRGDGQWREFEVKLSGLAGFSGTLTMLRLDPVNGGGEDAAIRFEWVRLIQKAPVLVCAGFSADKAILEPGEQGTLTLRVANLGGGSVDGLAVNLDAPPGVAVEAPRTQIRWSDETQTGEARWGVTATHAGQPFFRASVKGGEKTLLEATCCLPVIDWAKLPEPGRSGDRLELCNDRFSLLLLGPPGGGEHGAALLRVKDGEEWKAVGVLSPLAQLVCVRDHMECADEIRFGCSEGDGASMALKETGGDLELRFDLAPGASEVLVQCRCDGGPGLGIRRFSGPVLRVGVGEDGASKTAAVFPGIEFLGENEPSSNVAVVGEVVGHRPSPPAYQITIPSLAVLRDGVLCGIMWDPLQRWDGRELTLPTGEFASPNFIDAQANHRIACFVPGAPWRLPNQTVAERPFELPENGALELSTRIFAAAGADIMDAAPMWYAAYGMPEAPPLPHTPERMLDIFMQGWAQTLWFPQEHGFNNHWRIGQKPYWDPRLAANILTHARQTGEKRWVEAIGLDAEATILELVGSMLEDVKPPGTHSSADGQTAEGLWRYEPPEGMAEKVMKWTGGKRDNLGEPGSINVGICANHAIGLLSQAMVWGDEGSFEAGMRALSGMERFRVPRGCEGWEVHIEAADVYASARLTDCYRMGYELTGDKRWLARARYWAYSGLPFLYCYEVPDTGPGATAHIPWPESIMGEMDLVFEDPDAHQPNPWGSIPVFGTSFHRVSWFGNLVQWCGLCWAKSVYPLLEYTHDDTLRAAADGVVCSGIHQTFDKEPYVGLLPDTWHLHSNVMHPALIGPVRVEDPLRLMIGAPEFGRRHTKVVLRDPPWSESAMLHRRAHVSSRGPLSRLLFTERELRWTQRFPVGEVCETLVLCGPDIHSVIVGDSPLPKVEDILDVDEGWQELPDVGGIGIRVKHAREWVTVSLRL